MPNENSENHGRGKFKKVMLHMSTCLGNIRKTNRASSGWVSMMPVCGRTCESAINPEKNGNNMRGKYSTVGNKVEEEGNVRVRCSNCRPSSATAT